MTEKKVDVDTKAAVQALEYLLTAGYVSKRRLYVANFMRGLFFGFGSVLGATVLVAIMIWLLSFFSDIPFIGDIVVAVRDSINTAQQR
ncbi:MAG TPA: DUF5665 domain-containing protein [Candidatus Saccharibacteria bacterium]|jgi:hypothetical protein|nr:hypothetical protein [Patescibacteria group bacterium]HMS30794.1 DUF5665 domain-containing protein [Candidatus Saccharibacteria bacterium]